MLFYSLPGHSILIFHLHTVSRRSSGEGTPTLVDLTHPDIDNILCGRFQHLLCQNMRKRSKPQTSANSSDGADIFHTAANTF